MPNDAAVVWIHLGNCRKPELFNALEKVLPEILGILAQGAKLVEVR